MPIGQADVGKQVNDSFVNMAYAMLVAIGLVYLLLVPLVICPRSSACRCCAAS